jgi:rhodanese-related sulfurtransferase
MVDQTAAGRNGAIVPAARALPDDRRQAPPHGGRFARGVSLEKDSRMSATLTVPDPAKAHDYFTSKMRFTTGPVELKRAIDAGGVVVVDVRAAEDYAKGHIPGAVSLPGPQWENPQGLARDKTNVLYCYSQVCHLAANAALSLTARGYPVMELEGGFEGWKNNGLPTEGSSGTSGEGGAEQPLKPSERSPKQENL